MKKTTLLLTLLCLWFASLKAQEAGVFSNEADQKLYENAKSLFDEKLYTLAYSHFNTLIERHPKNFYLKYLKGICCIFISDKHEEALEMLSAVKTKNPKAADIDFYFALYFHKTYQFDLCIDLATAVLEDPKLEPALRERLKTIIDYSRNGKEVISHTLETKIENLGNPPNSEDDEYSPVVTADEKTLLFTYRGVRCKGGLRDVYDEPNAYGFYYEDIFMSRKVDGQWQQPVSLDNVNTESNEAVLTISNDGQQLFIYRASETDGGDIYMSTLNGDEFGKPERLKGEVNTNNWEGSITLSGDEKKIIFSSDRPGGVGGKDLYQAVKLGENTWGNVKNLGNIINTPYNEDGPFLHPDGRSLVFSSEGHNSLGDYDIFLSELNENDSSWKNPVNVGYPINTTDDDIFYTLSADGKRGYFSSSKTGGFGNKDIYVEEPVIFSKNSHLTIVKGIITENTQPYSCNINVLVGQDSHHYGTFKSNSLSGNYLISLPAGRNYKVVFDHPTDSDRVVNLKMDKNTDYSEMNVNINFGVQNASPVNQSFAAIPVIDSQKLDSTATRVAVKKMKTESPVVVQKTGEAEVTKNTPNKVVEKSAELAFTQNPALASTMLSRAELFNQYSNAQVNGLKYQVQVGAYRKPENFDSKKIEILSPIKKAGVIYDGINLLVVDKEFGTWKSADDFLAQIKSAGQKDAFVTANYDGKRLYMKQVAEMGLWGKQLLIAIK